MNNKFFKNLILFIFVMSVPFTTLLLCINHDLHYIKFLMIASFICGIYISKVYVKNELFQKFKSKVFICILLLSLYTISLLIEYSNTGPTYLFNILNNIGFLNFTLENIKNLISLLSVPSFSILLYIITIKIIPFIKKQYTSLTKVEKYFLICITLIGTILTFIIYNSTTAFYLPEINGLLPNDVIYTSDSGKLVKQNAFMNIGMEENDIRQPMFAVFSLPFAILSEIISQFLFFIPKIIIFNIIQIILLALSFIMLERMLELKGRNSILFLIFAFSTFSTVLFSFLIEQYVIALFYVILTLYLSHLNKDKLNYGYLGAISTLLISGILFPCLGDYYDIKKYIKNALKFFVIFIIVAIISSQILEFVTFFTQFNDLMRFGGKGLGFQSKFMQFLNFVSSIFIIPKSEIINMGGFSVFHMSTVKNYNISGIIILALCSISLILNYKNKNAILSFLWILFSFFILCLLGWGTQENGLILYTLYFSWGYIILIYLLFEKLIKKPKIKTILVIGLSMIMILYNVKGLIEIVKFGIKYYPLK